MVRHETVDAYIAYHEEWQDELKEIRSILCSTRLTEEVKWGAPIYTIDGKNIVGIGAFKSYVGVWFHQGALLKDDHKVLINAQEGVTKALRQWRFDPKQKIDRALLLSYIEEAIENQLAGKSIKPTKKPLIIPEELQEVLDKNPTLKAGFDTLSLTKKREHAEAILTAKRAETKQKRLEKSIGLILEGKGLHDKYR